MILTIIIQISIFFYKGKIYTSLEVEAISLLIKKNNNSVIMPKQSSLLFEKKVVLEWIGYNTPIFTDPTITPLVGTSFYNDFSDKTALSIYNQWLISLYLLTWEYKILYRAKLYIECNDMHRNILDIKDPCTIYWLNRQLRNQNDELLFFFYNKYYIVDFYSNKHAFIREIYEDITYVLLNIMLAYSIINSFGMDECVNR